MIFTKYDRTGLLLSVLLLASCGGSDDNTAAPATSGTPAPPASAAGAPTATSMAAATATATDNAQCVAIQPFYWEIGNANAAMASGSLGMDASGAPITSASKVSIASASKWLYGMYILQANGSATLPAAEIPFTNFTSGYTNMGDDTTSAECPPSDSPNDVNTCLTLTAANGLPYSYQDPATTGNFHYDAGHLENFASLYGGLGAVDVDSLGATVASVLGPNINLVYSEPLLPGGIVTTSADYVQAMQYVLGGQLYMLAALGTNAVCTQPSASCAATYSPIPEAWHYSITHWVEDDPATNGDGAFSSPGAFGFYPWIEAGKQYYGVISRENEMTGGADNGYQSAQCGRLIRKAWDSGVQQTAAIPQ